MFVHETITQQPEGIQLPTQILTRNQLLFNSLTSNAGSLIPVSDQIAVVFGHGLGSSDPRSKDHNHDEMVKILSVGCEEWQNVDSIFLYTARGHGASEGWQSTAFTDVAQFTWPRLAADMVSIGNSFGYQRLVVGGSSMGSATALYSAILYPELVKGVIMAKPPTGWAEREKRRKFLIRSADELLEKEQNDGISSPVYHQVLRGASTGDFPPLNDEEIYQKIKCPVLILALRGDPSHPEVTAYNLAERISNVELHFADNYKDAAKQWPSIIKKFISKL